MTRVLVLALAALTMLGQAAAARADGVAARVNGTPITDAMVNAVVKGVIAGRPQPPSSEEIARLSDAALDSLIDLELLYQAAQRQKLTVTDAEVEAEIARSRKQFASDAEFAAALKQSGLSTEQLRADTRKTLLVDKLLTEVVWKGVQIAPDAPRRFYDEHRAEVSRSAPEAAAAPFEAVEPSIREALLNQARDERQHSYVAELKRSATIATRHATAPSGRAAPVDVPPTR